jgi:hypothetical protein
MFSPCHQNVGDLAQYACPGKNTMENSVSMEYIQRVISTGAYLPLWGFEFKSPDKIKTELLRFKNKVV